MNTLIVLAIVIAAAVAKPHPGQQVSVNQDTLGNYNLKYAIDGISRVENRDIHGNVVGGWSYIDPHGFERKIEFTSGVHGFNAIGADIPLPVQDTPEVAHAKAAHLTILRAAELAAPPQPFEISSPHLLQFAPAPLVRSVPFAVAPVAHFAPIAPAVHQSLFHVGGIPETHEVAVARAEHLAAHAAARANHFLH